MKKTFVLDTNVLLHNAECLDSFADNTVVIPMAVLEELDTFKTSNNELGRNARQVIRRLDALRQQGSLRDGVSLPNSCGMVRIDLTPLDSTISGMDTDSPDNRIIQLAYHLHSTQEQPVTFVSKDINVRLKADALGVAVADFEREKINFDELYSGYTEITISQEVLDSFFANITIPFEPDTKLYPNQFVRLTAAGVENEAGPQKRGLARIGSNNQLQHLNRHYATAWNITARNKEQRLALELLLDPDVQIVTLVGQAGTGKTLLALAAALQATLRNHTYDRILVSRPIVPLGKDIGYLPGPKEEKLSHWMQPIFDNLHYLMREKSVASNKKRTRVLTLQDKIDKLMEDGSLILEALTYIRGRSIPRQYVIVDEAQNLTPHEVKTIVSRAGEGTKMVLTGDPYQIDNPYLDASSNGLTYAAERLKMHAIHGHITLHHSERSPLAALAAAVL